MTADFHRKPAEVLGTELAVHCNSIRDSIRDLFDAERLARIKSIWIKPNGIIKIQEVMHNSNTLIFLEKLKKGGLKIFSLTAFFSRQSRRVHFFDFNIYVCRH
jgi:hypothetical protein